jgi:SAM-dependent methyltransferase
MADSTHYVIRGGLQGRERLRVIGRVMRPSTLSLFDRFGLVDGLTCLDAGCGGGDATLDLARRVAPRGTVIGVDIDETKLRIARTEAQEQGVTNVEFRLADIKETLGGAQFDVVYSRFLLTHLSDPANAVVAFRQHLRPGGILAVEDVDFSGYFTYPESSAFRRYHELYCASVTRRGGDPNIGPRLPALLKQVGFEGVSVHVVQHISIEGEAKIISPLTMENISDVVVADGLASQEEVDDVVRQLYEFAEDPHTLAGTPRVVQAWGRRPS